MLTKSWEERRRSIFPIQEELSRKLGVITGVRAPAFLPSALPSAGFFPVEFMIASTAQPRQKSCASPISSSRRPPRAACSPSRRWSTCKIDQQNADIVIDRDKVASMGLSMQSVGADLASALGGNFVNRFNIDGRAYKVIPQIERARPTQHRATEGHLHRRSEQSIDAAQRRSDRAHGRRAAHA